MEFYNGQELSGVYYPAPNDIYFCAYNWKYVVGGKIEKITVVMESGQMAGVAWFAIWENGNITTKCNGSFVSHVTLKEA